MRKRDALREATKFVQRNYPDIAHRYIEVGVEEDGERRKSWSFGVHRDSDEPQETADMGDMVGYVHADGYVEGLY